MATVRHTFFKLTHYILHSMAQIVVNAMCKVHSLFKPDGYLLFDNLDSNSTEPVDCYTLYKYLLKENYKTIYIVQKNSPAHMQAIRDGITNNLKLINCNPFSLFCFLKLCFCAMRYKNVVTSHGRINFLLSRFWKKSQHCNYIHAQHGLTWTSNAPFTNNLSTKNYDKLIVNGTCEELFALSNGWNKDNLIKCGLFRFDNLYYNQEKQSNTILVMFTWRHSFDTNEKDTINIKDSVYWRKIKSLLSNELLHNILTKNNIKLIFIAHHYLLDYGNGLLEIPPNIVVGKPQELSYYIKNCSLLITDYSSVSFDILFQEKPVIYYHMDFDDPNRCNKDLQTHNFVTSRNTTLFNICHKESEVLDHVEYYIINNFNLEDNKKEIASRFFSGKGTACKTFVKLTS